MNTPNEVVINPTWWDESIQTYAEMDWSDVFGHLDTPILQQLRDELAESISSLRVQKDEVEFMREQCKMTGLATDDKTVVFELMALKANHFRWLEGELLRRSTPEG